MDQRQQTLFKRPLRFCCGENGWTALAIDSVNLPKIEFSATNGANTNNINGVALLAKTKKLLEVINIDVARSAIRFVCHFLIIVKNKIIQNNDIATLIDLIASIPCTRIL